MGKTNPYLIVGLIAGIGIASFIPIYIIYFNQIPSSLPFILDLRNKNIAIDGLGRIILVPKNPQRIISLGPSVTEILFNISCNKSRIVAITDYCNYPPDKIIGIPQIPNGFWTPSAEDIMAYFPDLVIGRNTPGQIDIISNLKEANIPIYIMPVERTVEDIFKNMKIIGYLINKTENASQEVAKLQIAMEKITNKVNGTGNSTILPNRVKTYYEIWFDPIFFAGGSTFIDDLIYKAGGLNLGRFFPGAWPSLESPGEDLIFLNPEHIIIPDWYDWNTYIKARPGWDGVVTAVINNNYTKIEQDIIERPGPRIINALRILAKDLCPSLFS